MASQEPRKAYMYTKQDLVVLLCEVCASNHPSVPHGVTTRLSYAAINRLYANSGVTINRNNPAYCSECEHPIVG